MALRREADHLPRICLSQYGEAFAFGPVIACAVMLDAQGAQALADLSRPAWPKMAAGEVSRTARRVQSVVPYEAVQLAPRKYNTLLNKMSAQRGRVLNWAYKTALTSLMEKYPECRAACFDVHAPGFAVLTTDLPRPDGLTLVFRGGEELDPGLAAAGVLARAHFERGYAELERKAGEVLPREGDAAATIASLIERGGGPMLLQMAKRDDPQVERAIAAKRTSG